jgi:hypothetical protein
VVSVKNGYILAKNEYSDEVNVMTMRSDGRVGIGTDAPA